jgi:hypothetical protein
MPKVIVQDWEESERGWGVRPDGFTFHLNAKDHEAYVKGFYGEFNNAKEVPDEYTRVSGDPVELEVAASIVAKLRKVKADMPKAWRGLGMHGEGSTYSSWVDKQKKKKSAR